MRVAPRRGEAIIAWGLVLLASYILFEASRMPAGVSGQPGPGFVPTGIGAVLLGSAIGLVIRAHRLDRAARDTMLEFGHGRIWVTLAALVGVALALEPLGYLLTATLLLIVLLRAFARVSWVATLLISIAGALVSWGFFHWLLGVPLPVGLLGLR